MQRFLLFAAAAVAIALASCHRTEVGAQTVENRLSEQAEETRQAKPLPDASLAAIVKSALVSESSLDANRIDVENKAGNVTLYGSVETPQQKEKAERIVTSVGGVKTVTNYLSIRDENAGTGSTAARDLPPPR